MPFTLEQLQNMGATPLQDTSPTKRSYTLNELQQLGAIPQRFGNNLGPSFGSTQQFAPSGEGPLQQFAMSPLNPVRDITAGTVGGLLRLTPSFRRTEQARQQAQRLGAPESELGPSGQDILSQAGAAPTVGQVVGSAIQTGTLLGGGLIGTGIKEAVSQVAPRFAPYAARFLSPAIEGASYGYGQALTDKKSQKAALQQALAVGLLNYAYPLGVGLAKVSGRYITKTIPEKLYQSIFKEASDDLETSYRAIAQGNVPPLTLKEQALKGGLFGSPGKMAVYSFKKLDQYENQLQKLSQNKFIKLSEFEKKEYIGFLQTIQQRFQSVFRNAPGGTKARQLIAEMENPATSPEGKLSASTALKVKRFMDDSRNTTSFRLDYSPKAGQTQSDFKYAADNLRNRLRKNSEFANLLNKERMYINFKDALIADDVRRGNRQILGLQDAIVGGTSLGYGGITGAIGAETVVRGLQTPQALTGFGQALYSPQRFIQRFPRISQAAGSTIQTAGRAASLPFFTSIQR